MVFVLNCTGWWFNFIAFSFKLKNSWIFISWNHAAFRFYVPVTIIDSQLWKIGSKHIDMVLIFMCTFLFHQVCWLWVCSLVIFVGQADISLNWIFLYIVSSTTTQSTLFIIQASNQWITQTSMSCSNAVVNKESKWTESKCRSLESWDKQKKNKFINERNSSQTCMTPFCDPARQTWHLYERDRKQLSRHLWQVCERSNKLYFSKG